MAKSNDDDDGHVCVVALASLIKSTRSFLGLVSKAKAAKLVRTLVDLFLDMEAGTGEEVSASIDLSVQTMNELDVDV